MNEKKKVLIITYYWPPSGGSGVQRWVKFAKYLRHFDWEPVIYTPDNPERPVIDESLIKDIPENIEVIKTRVWEPYSLYKKFVGLKDSDKIGAGLMKSGNEHSFLHDIAIWIRGNFFIPDARKFWVKPSKRFLKRYFSNNNVDAIISTGPPHSMHLIAEKISQITNIPWIADFRDPWTNIDFFEDLKLSKRSRSKHHLLEKRVLDKADKVVVISPTMKKEFQEITQTPVSVITNGFDEDDFKEEFQPKNTKFTISHIGMMTPTRNPSVLWESIRELCEESIEFATKFRLQLIGKTDAGVQKSVHNANLKDQVTFIDYVPHNEIVRYQQQSDALLLIVNNTPNASLILTGKFFEYLAAKRPIICISPVQGDMSEILNETQAGNLFTYTQKQELKTHLLNLFYEWKSSSISMNSMNTDKYSRKSLTKKLTEILDTVSK